MLNCTISTATIGELYSAWPGIVWCLTSAKNIKKSLNKSGMLAPAHVLWVKLLPVRSDVFFQKYILYYIDISLLKTKNKNTIICISLEQLRMINMQQTSAYHIFCSLSNIKQSLSLLESASIFLILTTRFFGMMVNVDINVYIIAHENLCKISWVLYSVWLISYNTCWAPARSRGRACLCYHIQTPARARTICDHARENSYKSSGAQATIKFAGDVQIAEIIRCQFYLWPKH